MKRDKIFTRNPDGRVIEIGNWEARTSDNDAFVGVPLSDSGLKKLRSGRERGRSDRQIFNDIHKKNPDVRKAFPIERLTFEQLLAIAKDLAEAELPSLNKLSKADLVELVRRMAQLKKVRVGIDIDFDLE